MQRTMKRTFYLGLTGIATAAIVFTAPFIKPVAIAQPLTLAQAPEIFEELDLTEEQKTAVHGILAARREDVSEIFTDAQRTQFQAAYQESQDFRTAIAATDDLTQDQKDALRQVFQGTRQDLGEILTEEQKTELQAIMQDRRRNR